MLMVRVGFQKVYGLWKESNIEQNEFRLHLTDIFHVLLKYASWIQKITPIKYT